MSNQSIPAVVFQPHAHQGLRRGINQLIAVVRPTLGPSARVVAVENTLRDRTPEILEDAGVIARRIIQLPNRQEDVGAMLLRHTLWQVQEEVGDGTATAAILFGAVYNHGLQYLAAGGNAMLLRRSLEQGLQVVLAALDEQVRPLMGKAALTQLAESLCFDSELAAFLGEMFDIIGPYGALEIRNSRGRAFERHYVEGMYWPSGVLSPYFYSDPGKQRTDLTNAAILISDLDLDDPRQMMTVIESALQREQRTLLIIANKLSESVLGLLIAAGREPARMQILVVRTPETEITDQAMALQDLALVTGGRPLLKAAGDSLRGFSFADLGYARRVWGDQSRVGIISGKGNVQALRQHLLTLRAAHQATTDSAVRSRLQQRIGRLLGGAATLLIGGDTEAELTVREERARKTSAMLRLALHEGVLPGGGVALLACRPRLQARLEASSSLEERAAYRILLRAVEEPFRTIAANAGFDPMVSLSQISQAGDDAGFDARTGQVRPISDLGIYDIASVQKAVIRTAISSAATTLTVDTLVHKRVPESIVNRP